MVIRPETPPSGSVEPWLAREAFGVGAPGFVPEGETRLDLVSMLRLIRLLVVTFFATLRKRWVHGPARPTWSFSFEATVGYLRRDWDETASLDLVRLRKEMGSRPYPQPLAKRVTVKDDALGGVPARWFTPPGAPEDVAVLFFHGGSYIYGSARTTHADLITRIALAAGLTTIGIDYRLAPEHPYSAQLEDALAAYEALVARGVKRVLLAGDSAGGNLAIEAQLALRDRGAEQAAAAALISPWSDLTMPGRSFIDNEPYDFGTRKELVVHAKAFAGDVALDDPRLSPTYAKLEGLRPTFIHAGEAEILRDDILLLADRLEAAGVEVTRFVAPDMPHNAPMFAAYHSTAQASLAAIGAFLRHHGVRGAA